MFTGIVQAVGSVLDARHHGQDLTLLVGPGVLDLRQVQIGDSVAVNGVCLTAVKLDGDGIKFDVSAETLSRSLFASMQAGTPVNLELALQPMSRFGGHFVSGHVDGIGDLVAREEAGRCVKMHFRAPLSLARYIAAQGSISIDGVSLTVNAVDGPGVHVNIVPHTLRETTLGGYQAGQRVHLEVDLIARYVERLMSANQAIESSATITEEFLAAHGFAPSKK